MALTCINLQDFQTLYPLIVQNVTATKDKLPVEGVISPSLVEEVFIKENRVCHSECTTIPCPTLNEPHSLL